MNDMIGSIQSGLRLLFSGVRKTWTVGQLDIWTWDWEGVLQICGGHGHDSYYDGDGMIPWLEPRGYVGVSDSSL